MENRDSVAHVINLIEDKVGCKAGPVRAVERSRLRHAIEIVCDQNSLSNHEFITQPQYVHNDQISLAEGVTYALNFVRI